MFLMSPCLVNHKAFLAIMLCVSFMVFFSGCLDQNEEGDGVVTMTMKEFVDDYKELNDNENKTFTGWFESVDAGDTVLIHDTIAIMLYEDTTDTTYVEFSSLGGRTVQFPVEGFLDAVFQLNETIEFTLHIISVNFTQEITPSDSIYVDIETYREGWDSERNAPVPIPQDIIQRV